MSDTPRTSKELFNRPPVLEFDDGTTVSIRFQGQQMDIAGTAGSHFQFFPSEARQLRDWLNLALEPSHEPQAVQTRTVTVPACEQHEGHHKITVTLPWICPECGGPRGEIVSTLSYDGSRRLTVDGWNNPCGHVDKYSAVRQEAAEFAARASQPPAPEWQAIETAPKDGTAFLAISGNWIVCMSWNKHRLDWCTVDKHYCPLPEDETFTHWMPLPSSRPTATKEV